MTRDVLAGLAVAGLLLPSAIAYAAIAGLAPEHAIVATILGLTIYAGLGRSRFAMVAPTSSSAAILAAIVMSMHGAIPGPALANAAILAAGGCFLAAAALRAGALASFISRPVLRGFSFGIALTITIRQLPAMTGVSISSAGAGVLPLAWRLAAAAAAFRPGPIVLAAASLAALIAFRRWPALPGSALVLAAGILLSALVNLPAWHIALVGTLTLSAPSPAIPIFPVHDWLRIMQVSVPLFLILFAESWGSIRGLALLHGDKVATGRELLALGCANAAAGLFQGMPVGAGFSASSAAESAGAQSRLAGLAAMAVLALMSLAGSGLVALIPTPVLAAVVVASLFHALNPAPLTRLWRIRRDELVATAAAAAVLALGVLYGMFFAIGFSLLALLSRLSAARLAQLGQLAGTHDFVDTQRNQAVLIDPAILILRPMEPLFFANAERVLEAVTTQAADPLVKTVILSLEESANLDSTALDALLECQAALSLAGKRLLLARVKEDIFDLLTAVKSNLAGAEYSFLSVADAYEAARQK